MRYIFISELTIISWDNGLSPGWNQAIILTNVGILLIGPLGTKFSEISIEIHAFSFKTRHLKMLSAKWPQCVNWIYKLTATPKVISVFWYYQTLGVFYNCNDIVHLVPVQWWNTIACVSASLTIKWHLYLIAFFNPFLKQHILLKLIISIPVSSLTFIRYMSECTT